jgi:hypothetical protein
VAIPTAVTPPDGAEDTPTVGTPSYPPPLFETVNNLTPPSKIESSAVAVTAAPTSVRVWVRP